MDRRDFLTATKRKFSTQKINKTPAQQLATGLAPYTGPWTTNEVAHLLKRTMLGARKADIDYFLGLTASASVDELLINIQPPSGFPVRDYGLLEGEDGSMYDDVGVAHGQTWINDMNKASDQMVRGSINSARVASLRKWWAGQIINQNRSIGEKMVLFWHHHFSVQKEEVENATMLYRHHDLLRRNVLGNVRQITKDITIDPAMLVHLNNCFNSKRAPDENYARELQELFAVGTGDDSLYTENDVMEAARVLTGWRIDDDTLTSYFDASDHDVNGKIFSSFYNNKSIPGSSNGAQELDEFINMIYATSEASRFFCRKLYKWFVYYQIDDETETNVIIPLAQILENNNYEVKPVLDALLKSEHFFDTYNQACYIKNPFDFIVGTLREFNVSFPPLTDHSNGYPLFHSIYSRAAEMQMDLFQPPDVSGWPTYYQDPMHYELWVNSNSLPHRADFTDALVNGDVVDVRAFANYSSDPADPNTLINDVSALLLRYPLSPGSKTYIKNSFLINNSGNDSVWTNAWNTNNNTFINASLKDMFRFLMNLPEFHLC